MKTSEKFEIARRLQGHDALFRGLWDIADIYFDENCPTAAVEYNRDGDCLGMVINPHLWEQLSDKEKDFIVCHELEHFVGNHGARFGEYWRGGQEKARIANIGADVCINESLIRCYGFDRRDLSHQLFKNIAFVDTVFTHPDGTVMSDIPTNESSDFYIGKLEELVSKASQNGKGGEDKGGLSKWGLGRGENHDDHSGIMNASKEDTDKIQDILERNGLGEFVERNKKRRKSNSDSVSQDASKNIEAGVGSGVWAEIKARRKPRKRKWESIIRRWVISRMKDDENYPERWDIHERRMTDLLESNDFILPSNPALDYTNEKKDKIRLAFFLDTSGSCYDLKDRFFEVASSIPKERFEVRLFCFDTQVYETTLESNSVYGGGGTDFRPVVRTVEKLEDEEGWRPHAVFAITDGNFPQIKTVRREHDWHVFLTPQHNKKSLPSGIKMYDLADFE